MSCEKHIRANDWLERVAESHGLEIQWRKGDREAGPRFLKGKSVTVSTQGFSLIHNGHRNSFTCLVGGDGFRDPPDIEKKIRERQRDMYHLQRGFFGGDLTMANTPAADRLIACFYTAMTTGGCNVIKPSCDCYRHQAAKEFRKRVKNETNMEVSVRTKFVFEDPTRGS